MNRDSSLRNCIQIIFETFNSDLYSSALVKKLFNSSKVKIITVKMKAGVPLNVLPHICPLNFITEALHLVATAR